MDGKFITIVDGDSFLFNLLRQFIKNVWLFAAYIRQKIGTKSFVPNSIVVTKTLYCFYYVFCFQKVLHETVINNVWYMLCD